MILFLDDKQLNKFLPLNRLTPYRDQEYNVDKFTLMKNKKLFEKIVERKKKQLIDELQAEKSTLESNKKTLLGSKRGKEKKGNERRLDTYEL